MEIVPKPEQKPLIDDGRLRQAVHIAQVIEQQRLSILLAARQISGIHRHKKPGY